VLDILLIEDNLNKRLVSAAAAAIFLALKKVNVYGDILTQE
jgi:hypothetical protein